MNKGVLGCILLFLILSFQASILPDKQQLSSDEIRYYVNPNGGRYFHIDEACDMVNEKYLPMKVMTSQELERYPYTPCPLCIGQAED